jgi:ankyrin repeat protein
MNDPPATAAELVSRGAVLMTHRGRSPCTALHEAAHRGYLEIVKLLLENGADATVVEPRWAEHDGNLEIAALLRQHASGE